MVITRFAPSPTGHLHIGGARTALFCWAWARRNGGRFLLRIEDTDQARSSDAATRGILEDLAWLGITWDEGPDHAYGGRKIGGDPRGVGPWEQSNRLKHYDEWMNRLIAEGKAYAAFESAEELEAKRKAAQDAKQTYKYDRGALALTGEERIRRVAAGERHVVRFRVPDDVSLVVEDVVLGEVRFGPGEVEDFVIRKADGFPTYHMAVVVDDALMGVTHVLRGQEHLANTPKHVALQRALSVPTPVYAHMPLIFNDRGAKMSKRERDQTARDACKAAGIASPPAGSAIDAQVFEGWLGDKKRQLETNELERLAAAMSLELPEVSVEDFRAAGYLPSVVCNFIALMGWTPPKDAEGKDVEKFTMDQLASWFDVSGIGKTNAKFDRTKLGSFNADAIGAMGAGELAELWAAWCDRYAPPLAARVRAMEPWRRELMVRAAQPRSKTLRDIEGVVRFALIEDDAVVFDEKAVKKALEKGEPTGYEVLAMVRPELEGLAAWDVVAIDDAVKRIGDERGIGMGRVAQPLRVAVTGGMVSPGLGETLALVGKQGVLRRIDRCLAGKS